MESNNINKNVNESNITTSDNVNITKDNIKKSLKIGVKKFFPKNLITSNLIENPIDSTIKTEIDQNLKQPIIINQIQEVQPVIKPRKINLTPINNNNVNNKNNDINTNLNIETTLKAINRDSNGNKLKSKNASIEKINNTNNQSTNIEKQIENDQFSLKKEIDLNPSKIPVSMDFDTIQHSQIQNVKNIKSNDSSNQTKNNEMINQNQKDNTYQNNNYNSRKPRSNNRNIKKETVKEELKVTEFDFPTLPGCEAPRIDPGEKVLKTLKIVLDTPTTAPPKKKISVVKTNKSETTEPKIQNEILNIDIETAKEEVYKKQEENTIQKISKQEVVVNTKINKDNQEISKEIKNQNIDTGKKQLKKTAGFTPNTMKINVANETKSDILNTPKETIIEVKKEQNIVEAETKNNKNEQPKIVPDSKIFSVDFLNNYINDFKEPIPEEVGILLRNIRCEDLPMRRNKDRVDRNSKKDKDNNKFNNGSSKQISGRNTGNNYPASKSEREVVNHKLAAELQRSNFNEEKLKQIKEWKESAGEFLMNQMLESDEVKIKRKINQTLNSLTPENFYTIIPKIKEFCQSKELSIYTIDTLIQMAWFQPTYSRSYSELVKKICENRYSWEDPTQVKHEILYKMLIPKVENQYIHGFEIYKSEIIELENSTTLENIEKFEIRNKKKKKMHGNINFICDLFLDNIIGYSILKTSIIYGIGVFIKEFIISKTKGDKFKINLDFLESIMKFFQKIGKEIEERDLKHDKNTSMHIENEKNLILKINNLIISQSNDYEELVDLMKVGVISKSIHSITNIFFEFLKSIQKQDIGQKLDSLIENIMDYKSSNWISDVGKLESAKTLSESRKDTRGNKDHNSSKYKDNKGKDDKNKQNNSEVNQEEIYECLLEDLEKYIDSNTKNISRIDYLKIFERSTMANGITLMRCFLETFATNLNKENMTRIYDVPLDLFMKRRVNELELIKALNISSKKLYSIYSDAPLILEYIAKFILILFDDGWIDVKNFKMDMTLEIDDEDEKEEFELYKTKLKTSVKKVFEDSGVLKEDPHALGFN